MMPFLPQLIVVLVPIVGLGAFLWWAGRDMVQGTVSFFNFRFLVTFLFASTDFMDHCKHFSSEILLLYDLLRFFSSKFHRMAYVQCPNCGNDFQIFK